MGFFGQLLAELDARNSYLLVFLVIICLALRGMIPEAEKKRVKGLITFTLAHLGLVLFTAWVAIQAPESVRFVRLPSFICSIVAYAGVFNFIVFSMVLARFNVRVHLVLRDVVTIVVVVVSVLFMSARLGFNLAGVAFTSAGLATVIGLAMQDTITNMMGRVTLQLDRSVGLGDWISLDNGPTGQVTQMRWRYTTLQTNNWETVVIPNSQLLKSRFTALGRRENSPTQLRRWIRFHVDYKVPPAEVLRLVGETLNEEEIPHVAHYPKPHAILEAVDESTAKYAARYWLTDILADDATDSVVRLRVFYALRRSGIEVAIPAHSVLLTEQDEAHRAAAAEADLRKRSAALGKVGLFRALTEEERMSLARSMRRAPFAEGELLTRQGADAHWLYIIEKGRVGVRVSAGDGSVAREVATLSDGDFFGEMGLMTGEPRSATVAALGNVDCFRLDKEAFHELLKSRPEIAEQLAEELARRKTELEGAKETLDKDARVRRQAETKGRLLTRIKHFFSI